MAMAWGTGTNSLGPMRDTHLKTILFSSLLLPLLLYAVPRPSVVLLLCDNLGYGDIEPFRPATPHRTPALNRMAKEGLKLTHFYATAGVCTPSRASIMTGCYAQRVSMHKLETDHHVLRPVSPLGLHPDEITVAELLKRGGYATTLIGKWHLGDQPAFLPTRQGFDSYYGIPYSDDMTGPRTWQGRSWPPLPLMENERVVEAPADRDTLTRRYTDRAVRFIRTHQGEPFFLVLSHAMPGSTKTPYASKAFKGKSRNGPWGDAVEEIDWSTGRILDLLVELGLAKNTLVIWTSDNGAPNNPGDIRRGTNKPLFGRGYTTSEGGMRVPTIAWWPGRIPAGSTSSELATTMDFLPTFCRLAGVKAPGDRIIDGHDIMPILSGETGAFSRQKAFFYYQLDQLQAVRSGPWKLLLPLENPIRPGRVHRKQAPGMLIHVVDDPTGKTDHYAAHPRVVERLFKLAEEARRDLGDTNRKGSGQRPAGRVAETSARTLPPVD